MTERRRTPRRRAGHAPWTRVRLRPGREAAIVDVGPHGALVEGPARLLPGAAVVLQLVGPHRSTRVTGRVLRCQVSAIDAIAGVRYRGAISFDEAIEIEHAAEQEPG